MLAADYIGFLGLQPHPEGGYYKETYRSGEAIPAVALPGRFNGSRLFSTAIYYLLQQNDFSCFHRIKSDECWHFYAGGTLLIHVLHNDCRYEMIRLGNRIGQGELLQFVVPAGAWFAAEPAPQTGFALLGCTVAPGFDFADFEMAKRPELAGEYPGHLELITRLSRM